MSIDDHLQPDEEILYEAKITRLVLLPWIALLAIFLAVAVFAWFGMNNKVALTLAALAPAVIVALVLAWKWFVLNSYQSVLTNHRVIRVTGILNRQSMDSRLDKVNNIEHRQSLLGRLLAFGDVEIDTASEVGAAVFHNVSHPLEFKRAIAAAAEQYRAPGRVFAAPAGPSGAERLRQLKALLDDGLVSRDEYEDKRKQLLSEL
jgi:uncharacterized membrane protein YdbT with pleckstrin-like domain